MMRYLLALLFCVFSATTVLAEGTALVNFETTKAPIDRGDMDSIKRGAKFFATNCMSCHTMVYLRYNKVAIDAGITYDKMPINVKTWPYGVTPPDLSLEADVRGVDWIYTYLHSFYQDPSRPTGVNNLLVPNTAMPGILVPYQGEQVLNTDPFKYDSALSHKLQWYNYLILSKEGSMTSEQYNDTIADVVNFLAYASEPFHIEQQTIGYWVLGFLVIMFILSYLLKKEYWKDVKKRRKE